LQKQKHKAYEKNFFCLALLLLATICHADEQFTRGRLYLQVRIIDPTVQDEPIGRNPVDIPLLSVEANNISFITPCDGYTLRLVNEEGGIDYSIRIAANTSNITIPSYLTGEYELQLIRGQYCYYGYIEF